MSRYYNTLVVVLFAVFSSSTMGATADECATRADELIGIFLSEYPGQSYDLSCYRTKTVFRLDVYIEGKTKFFLQDLFPDKKTGQPGRCSGLVIQVVEEREKAVTFVETLESDEDSRAWKKFVRGSCKDLL